MNVLDHADKEKLPFSVLCFGWQGFPHPFMSLKQTRWKVVGNSYRI